MEIKSITYGYDKIVKAVILSNSGQEYTASIDGDSNITWCTCPFYIFKKTACKHILYLLENLDYKNMKPTKRFQNFLCGCTTIDTLMGNGIPLGSVTAVFGEPGQGKTLFSAQLALSCIKNLNKDIIVIETEGNREQDYLELLYRFKDRWGLSEEDILGRIHFYPIIGEFQSQAMITLLQLVGYDTNIEQSKSGDKYTITFRYCKPKLKEDDLSKSGLLVIDSLTKPLKATIGHKTQNLPARAELSARLFDRIYQIAYNYNLAVVINHHACHDENTLTLTKEKGISSYEEVNIGDSVLALDKNGKTIWNRVLDKLVYDYDDEMVYIKSKSVNQCITPNHRVLWVPQKNNGSFDTPKYREASTYPKRGLYIPKSSQITPLKNVSDKMIRELSTKYPNEFLEGWYIAEGYSDKKELSKDGIKRYGVRFCINLNDMQWITPILDSLNIKYWISKIKDNEIQLGISRKEYWQRFQKFGTNAKIKCIPIDILESYNVNQLRALLYGYLLGDGRRCYKDLWTYTTVSKKLVESLIILCAKIGNSITYKYRIVNHNLKRCKNIKSESYYGYIRPHNKSIAKSTVFKYKGKVWCLTTEHGNFLIIRDGKPSFSGNSVNKTMAFARDFGSPYGGDEVLYNSKYVIEFVNSDMAARAKFGKGAKRVMLVKHPFNPINSEMFAIHLKENYGFTDE